MRGLVKFWENSLLTNLRMTSFATYQPIRNRKRNNCIKYSTQKRQNISNVRTICLCEFCMGIVDKETLTK